MNVLEDDHRRFTPWSGLGEEGPKNLVPPSRGLQQTPNLAAERTGDVDQRRQRLRRRERVAGADQHPHAAVNTWGSLGEAADDRRLADARLSPEQHQPTAPRHRLAQEPREAAEERRPFQWFHGRYDRAMSDGVNRHAA